MIRKSSDADLAIFRDRSSDPVDRASALSRLVSDHAYELEPEILQLFEDPEPLLRSEAVVALVGRWRREAVLGRALDLLRRDPRPSVRRDAAGALAMYVSREHHRVDDVARALADRVRNDPDPTTQRRCYEELLRILAPERAARVPLHFEVVRDVDWDLVRPYIDPPS